MSANKPIAYLKSIPWKLILTSCFKFVYPISYIMSDGSTISGSDRKEIHIAMKAYFEANGKSKENRPSLNLPVQIMVLDDDKNEITIDITNL